jgi:hypothetical protein
MRPGGTLGQLHTGHRVFYSRAMAGGVARGRLAVAIAAALAWALPGLRAAEAQVPSVGPGPGGAIDGSEGSTMGLPPERVVRVQIPPPAPALPPSRFQMGFEYSQTLDEDGDLAYAGQSARSVGLHFVFPEGRVVRPHFALAHQWERSGTTVRQGFRFDLFALGFPIPVFDGAVRVEIEPILRPLRGLILFEDDGAGTDSHSLLRLESGFALGLRLGRGLWFVTFEPLSIDFRTVVATQKETRTGFARVWSLATVIGRDF